VFLYTIDIQETGLLCSYNDNLACNSYRVLIVSSVSGIVNVMCLVIPPAACLY